MKEKITAEQFHLLTRPLIGLPVSRTWRGYGSAIFFELGKLTEKVHQRKDGSFHTTHKGEAGIMIEWSWRVERPKSVLFGSWSGNQKITNRLSKLQDLNIVEIMVEGRLPELVIQLSGGFWVHSFTTVESQPEWCLFSQQQPYREWITSHNGVLLKETEEPETEISQSNQGAVV